MREIKQYCDICGEEFKSKHWNDSPVRIDIKLSQPAQKYDSFYFEEVCRPCCEQVCKSVKALVKTGWLYKTEG